MPFFKDLACQILREQYGCYCDRNGCNVKVLNHLPTWTALEKNVSNDKFSVCLAIKKLARLESKVGTGPINDDE